MVKAVQVSGGAGLGRRGRSRLGGPANQQVHPLSAGLDDLRGLLRGAVPQVLVVDCQHVVVAAQAPVLGGQPALQQVQHEHARLVCAPHQLDAQLLRRVPLVQHDPQAGGAGGAALGGRAGGVGDAWGEGVGGGGGGGGGRRGRRGAAPLPQHGELQGRASVVRAKLWAALLMSTLFTCNI